MFQKNLIKAIGFDLDETLYPSDPKINNHIRNTIAQHIQKKLNLPDIKNARKLFDSQYFKLPSTQRVLLELGFSKEEINDIKDQSTNDPKIAEWLVTDNTTIAILKEIQTNYKTFLITASKKESAEAKLTALKIDSIWFQHRSYGSEKYIGDTFTKMCETFFLAYNILPQEMVFIGNSRKADIIPAKKTGMKTISIGSKIPEADFSVSNFHELKAIL